MHAMEIFGIQPSCKLSLVSFKLSKLIRYLRTMNKTIFQRTRNENFEVLSNAKCRMHKSIKLNYFEHINILGSCNQPGIENKSSNFIPGIQGVIFEKKIQGLISIHCEVSEIKCFVSVT